MAELYHQLISLMAWGSRMPAVQQLSDSAVPALHAQHGSIASGIAQRGWYRSSPKMLHTRPQVGRAHTCDDPWVTGRRGAESAARQ